MEDIVQPIIAKLYQGQGGAPPGGEEEEDVDRDELWGCDNFRLCELAFFLSIPSMTLKQDIY